jgi:hypothetical protein
MSRFSRFAVLAGAAALIVASVPGSAPATEDGPIATAAKRCSAGDYSGYDTTYVYSPIRARRISCKNARALVRKFHECRPDPAGRCPSPGRWSCSEDRFNKTRFQYDSRVRCKKGGKRVKHRYTQNI